MGVRRACGRISRQNVGAAWSESYDQPFRRREQKVGYMYHAGPSCHKKRLQRSLHLTARWPSGLRRQLKEPGYKPRIHSYAPSRCNSLVRKGVGSNPTLVNPFAVRVSQTLYMQLSTFLHTQAIIPSVGVTAQRPIGPTANCVTPVASPAKRGRPVQPTPLMPLVRSLSADLLHPLFRFRSLNLIHAGVSHR